MTKHPELTAGAFSRELKVLRKIGLYPAIEKGKLPLLSWLARQVAAKDDPTALELMMSVTSDARRRATAEQTRRLIEPVTRATTELPENGAQAIDKLFALHATSVEDTPENEIRHNEAANAIPYSTKTFKRYIVAPLLTKLADAMYDHYYGYAIDQEPEPVIDETSEPVQPEAPNETTPNGGDSSTEAEAETLIAPKQPTETDAAETLDTELPVEPEHGETPQPSEPPVFRGPSRRVRYLAPLIAAIGVAVLVFVLATDHGGIFTTGKCGSTTAQLFSSGSSVTTSSAIYIYAPHQEGSQHGWANSFAVLLGEPKQKEAFRTGEVRLLALSYHNQSASTTENNLIARAGLPQGSKLQPNSVCLYRGSNYSSGISYSGTPLLESTGLSIGNAAPNEYVYITFKAWLPKRAELNADIYGGIGDQAELGSPDWTQKVSHIQIELTS